MSDINQAVIETVRLMVAETLRALISNAACNARETITADDVQRAIDELENMVVYK